MTGGPKPEVLVHTDLDKQHSTGSLASQLARRVAGRAGRLASGPAE